MKGIAVLLLALSLAVSKTGSSQVSEEEVVLLHTLDSLQHTPGSASHFAFLYFETTVRAIKQFASANEKDRVFIRRLETRFASFFLEAVNANNSHTEIPPVWRSYFSGNSLTPLQYQLLGINAHINGDLWQALAAEFNKDELTDFTKAYFRFNKGLKWIYRHFYDHSVDTKPSYLFLNNISFGLSKWYGSGRLLRWRKRQMRLALYHFTNPGKFNALFEKNNRKMMSINNLILRDL